MESATRHRCSTLTQLQYLRQFAIQSPHHRIHRFISSPPQDSPDKNEESCPVHCQSFISSHAWARPDHITRAYETNYCIRRRSGEVNFQIFIFSLFSFLPRCSFPAIGSSFGDSTTTLTTHKYFFQQIHSYLNYQNIMYAA